MIFKNFFIYTVGFSVSVQLSMLGMYRMPVSYVAPKFIVGTQQMPVLSQQAMMPQMQVVNPEQIQQAAIQATVPSKPWTNMRMSGPFRATRPNLFRATAPKFMTRDEACEILGLEEGETSAAIIKKAYQEAVLRAHPDVGGSDEKMKLVNEAMGVLRKIKAGFSDAHESAQSSEKKSTARTEKKQQRRGGANAQEKRESQRMYQESEAEETLRRSEEAQAIKFIIVPLIVGGVVIGTVRYFLSTPPVFQIEQYRSDVEPSANSVWNIVEQKTNYMVNRKTYRYESVYDGRYWTITFKRNSRMHRS